MANFFAQSFFLPKAPITEENCPDQKDRVFIVTGGYAGVGYELSQILYGANATVYVAGRSESKASDAIARLQKVHPNSTGRVVFLQIDLADLTTIKPAVQSFTTQEQRLDVLVNNAGIMFPPKGSVTKQSHDLQLGTNCLGHFLFYKLLSPVLDKTANSAPTNSVRVAWAGSIGIDLSPKPGGMKLKPDGAPEDLGPEANYIQSKTGNLFLAKYFAQTTATSSKVIHVGFNPGNLRTELQRHWKGIGAKITDWLLLFPAVHGAYTELWAAIAPEAANGTYVWPWGRIGTLRRDVEQAVQGEVNGGTGLMEKFIAWCDKETAAFA